MESARPHGHSFTHTYAQDNARIHQGDVHLYAGSSSSEEQLIVEWLTTLNPSRSHTLALSQYQPGTLKDFFENELFLEWQDVCSPSRMIWCRGGMGTGKSTLAGQVWTRLQRGTLSRSDVAILYGRWDERNLQTAEAMLGSILVQLFQRDREGYDIPLTVKKAYKSQSSHLEIPPSMRQLQSWLEQRLEHGKPTFVILDALDEMDILEQRALLRVLQSGNCSNLKLLVTSRDIPDIGHGLLERREIAISAGRDDIRTLALAKLREQTTEHFRDKILSTPARNSSFATVEQEILIKLLESTDNMFLLASLHLDRILKSKNLADIYQYLDDDPAGLYDFYDQAWARATGDSDSLSCKRAKLIIMWIFAAEQPLSMQALREALSASENSSSNSMLITEEEVLSSCAGLIRVEPLPRKLSSHTSNDDSRLPTDMVNSLAHSSVQRYLEENRGLFFPLADDIIVAACLASDFPTTWTNGLVQFFPPYHCLTLYTYHVAVTNGSHRLIAFSVLLAFSVSEGLWGSLFMIPLIICWYTQASVFRMPTQTASPSISGYKFSNLHRHTAKANIASKAKVAIIAATDHRIYMVCFMMFLGLGFSTRELWYAAFWPLAMAAIMRI